MVLICLTIGLIFNLLEIRFYGNDEFFQPFNFIWNFGIYSFPISFYDLYLPYFIISSIIFSIGIVIQVIYYIRNYSKFLVTLSFPLLLFGISGLILFPIITIIHFINTSNLCYYGVCYYNFTIMPGLYSSFFTLILIPSKFITIELMRYYKKL